jgi:ABC-type nitrate/sulfonate/bicarbonate transport system substrate-binding protein
MGRQRWLGCIVLVACLAGCAGGGAGGQGPVVARPDGATVEQGRTTAAMAPAAAPAGTLEKITIPLASAAAPFAPHVMAQLGGFFREEGLDADLPVMRSNLIVAGVAAGELHYSGQGTPTIRGALAGVPIRLIATIVSRSTRWLVAQPDVQGVAGLRGQAIAVGVVGDGPYNSASLALEQFGIDPATDVNWLATGGGTPERLVTMQQGLAQASVVNNADLPRAEALGFVPLLRLDEVAPLPEAALGASLTKLESERDQVKHVVRAMVRALRYVKANREGSLPAFMQLLQVTREEAADAYDAAFAGYSDDGTLPERTLRFAIEAEKRQLQMAEPVAFARVADFGALYEVLAELGVTPAPDSAR